MAGGCARSRRGRPRSRGQRGGREYDGSAPLVCAATTVSECVADGRCQRRNAETVNFPALFKVDVKAMKLWELGAEKPRETALRNVDRANNKTILSGAGQC